MGVRRTAAPRWSRTSCNAGLVDVSASAGERSPYRRTMRSLVLAMLLIVMATSGCGTLGEEETGECAGGGATIPGCDGTPSPYLEVTVWPDGEERGSPIMTTLSCTPTGGDVADAEAACTLLADEGVDVFAPVPEDAPCTLLYGGPAEAQITGSVDGVEVNVRLSRDNGCEIDRWDRLSPMLPPFEPTPS